MSALLHLAPGVRIRDELGWRLEHLESWLFHGTDRLDEVLRSGFSSGHVNVSFNKYGAGVYFSRDPRLAHFFLRQARQDDHAEPADVLHQKL